MSALNVCSKVSNYNRVISYNINDYSKPFLPMIITDSWIYFPRLLTHWAVFLVDFPQTSQAQLTEGVSTGQGAGVNLNIEAYGTLHVISNDCMNIRT